MSGREQGPTGTVGEWPDVAVIEGEDVEHDERRRAGQRELPGPHIGGVHALLQAGEVQPARGQGDWAEVSARTRRYLL